MRRSPEALASTARLVGAGLRLLLGGIHMRKVPNLSISPEKVFFIVAKARQYDSKATESDLTTDLLDDDRSYGLEDLSKDTDRSELFGFIRGLNVDEQIDLVALMWLGRGEATMVSAV